MMIGARRLALDARPYIIAEIGVNHDGDETIARHLIDAAADAGADAVKLQYFRAESLLSARSVVAAYQRNAGYDDPRAMLERLELTPATLERLVAHARDRRIDPIVTIFSQELVNDVARFAWAAFKTASPDLIHEPLLRALITADRPLLISTGASTDDEIRTATTWIGDHPATFLHCVSAYPTPDDDAALGGIVALARLTSRPAGYSDHTSSYDTGALAVAAGAVVLERHLTHDTTATGPDHAASITPDDLRAYITGAHRAQRMRGAWTKCVQPIETDVRRVSRQSLVAKRAMPAGHVIELKDLTCKRPGNGLPPSSLSSIVGRALVRAIDADVPLTEDHFA